MGGSDVRILNFTATGCHGNLQSAGHASWPLYCGARNCSCALLSGTRSCGTCSSSSSVPIRSRSGKKKLLVSASSDAGLAVLITGPTSPYYLDDRLGQRIYVVQGTSVINSFPWAYNCEVGSHSQEAVRSATAPNGRSR